MGSLFIMKAYEIKEFDVLHVQRKAAIKTAKFLKVEYCDLMDYGELQKIIKDKDEALYELLVDFCTAYWNYYYYINTLNTQLQGNKMETREVDLLKDHIKQKDDCRTALLV